MTTFSELRPGDRINWNGADGNYAEVIKADLRAGTVTIEWTGSTGASFPGHTFRTDLSWGPDYPVHLVEDQ